MAITEEATGTLTANGTEQTVATLTGPGVFSVVIDRTAMASGDTIVLRLYDKVLAAGSARLVFEETFTGAQTRAWSSNEPIVVMHEGSVTLQQTGGTNRNYDYSVRVVG